MKDLLRVFGIFIAVSFLVIGITCCPAPAFSDQFRKNDIKAMQLLKEANQLPAETRDDLIEKEYAYRKILERYPDFAEALNNLGNVYENLQMYDKAILYYQKAIQNNPNLPEPYFGLGDVYFTMGNFSEAKKWYEEGLKRQPEDEIAQGRLKLIYNQSSKKGILQSEEIIAMLDQPILRGPAGKRLPKVVFSEGGTGEGTIHFDYDSFLIREDAKPQLDEIGKALSSEQLKDKWFEIAGHTDNIGTDNYNQVLSEKRAKSVVDYLVLVWGIDIGRLQAKGYGESRPFVPNTSSEDRAKNRRVEIINLGKITDKEPSIPKPKFAFQVSFLYTRDGKKVPIEEGAALSSEDNYQIHFQSMQDCYVYIFQEDSSGKVVQLFPNPNFVSYTNPVSAGISYWVPDVDTYFFLDKTRGEEKIFLIATKKPARDIEETYVSLTTMGAQALNERIQLRNIQGITKDKKKEPTPTPQQQESGMKIPTSLKLLVSEEDFYILFSFYNQGR